MRHINRIFFTFLIAYGVLILIPLFTGIFLNGAIVSKYEEHVKQSYLSNLENTQEILEGFIDEVKWSTYQLASNTDLIKLISENNNELSNKERSLIIRNIMSQLRQSLLYNTSTNSILYIYLKNQDLIITPYSLYRHSDFNTSMNFFNMKGISSKVWHDIITTNYQGGSVYPVRTTIIEDFKNKEMIPYVQSIPINSSKSNGSIKGAIVYLIGEGDFVKFFDSRNLPKGGFSYISDGNNNIISSVSNVKHPIKPIEISGIEGMVENKINGERKSIIYTTSDRNNWKYVSVLPTKWVLKNVRFYQIVSGGVMFIALILCFIAAYKISKKWSKPIETTFRSIEDFLKIDNREKESFQSLNISVNKLIDRGEIMQDELTHHQSFVHNAFVNRLINGFFNNESSVSRYLSHLGFELYENSFSVVIFSTSDIKESGSTEFFDELNRVKNIVKSRLQQDFKYRIMLSEQENSDLVLIVLSKNLSIHLSNLKDTLIDFLPGLPPLYKDNLIIGLGEVVSSLMDIHKSYIEAKELINSDSTSERPLIFEPADINKEDDNYYYPIEVESRLINGIKSGNLSVVEDVFEFLKSENCTKRALSAKRKESLYKNLLNSVIRINSQLCEENKRIVESLEEKSELSFDSMNLICLDLCKNQDLNKKSHNHSLIDDIMDFLNKNYQNKNLSLVLVGDHFSITESYLSFFFKEQTGINFSSYLENIRVEEGKKLLTTSDESICSIASIVGYNSDKTFRRVFQKNVNVSPSKFRKEKLVI